MLLQPVVDWLERFRPVDGPLELTEIDLLHSPGREVVIRVNQDGRQCVHILKVDDTPKASIGEMIHGVSVTNVDSHNQPITIQRRLHVGRVMMFFPTSDVPSGSICGFQAEVEKINVIY